MRCALGVFFAVLVGCAIAVNDHENVHKQSIVDFVNSNPASTWKAGFNSRFDGYSLGEFRKLLGVNGFLPAEKQIEHHVRVSLPDEFDSRTQWPSCTSIGHIRDQGQCGSCWAFGAVEAMSDRFCIQSPKQENLELSTQQLTSCEQGDGCQGGWLAPAWNYMRSVGVVSEECYPYEMPPCEHPCGKVLPAPACANKCTNGTKEWSKDKHHAKSVYSVSSRDIEQEIYKNGPVEGAFSVYEDFVHYKSGVYKHTTGGYLGGHAIKILGWGVEGGTPYWLIANSWNTNWGDGGYFKILRGKNECGIEGNVVAGMADV